MPLVGDARVTLQEMREALAGFKVEEAYSAQVQTFRAAWETGSRSHLQRPRRSANQSGRSHRIVNEVSGPRDVMVCAAGSLPGDLHKLWRTRDPNGYHMEYGYSCMGYEIAGGLGVKMAAPDREVYVLVGDGSYLMMAQEIVTAVAGGYQAQHHSARQPRVLQHRWS